MRVLKVWRYPVTSLQGERLPAAELGPLGIRPGDELAPRWAVPRGTRA